MEEFTYRIEESKGGSGTIIITRGGKDFPLHSRIDPLREGEKNAPDFNTGKYDLLIILGCGMGYHLSGLKDIAQRYTEIIVIDIIPCIERVIESSATASFLNKINNITFFSGIEPHLIEKKLMERIDLERFRGVQVVEHPGSFRLFTEYYESVKGALKRILDKKSGDRATVKAFGSIFFRNAINNLMNIDTLSPVSALKDKFTGSSALIVSSAPSAEDYIEEINIYRKKFLIIAVDSALPMLLAHGIIPEFAVSIDPQKRIHEHFLGHKGEGTIHIFSIVSPPSLVNRYGGFLSLNSHPISQVVEEFHPGAIGSIDSGTGSVAGDALNFALLAGFKNIGMTGFDFSFSRNIIYSRETSYQRRYSLYFNNRFVTPESFNAEYIFRGSGSLIVEGRYTRRSFTGYRESLVRFIAGNCKTPPVIINNRGLKVRNALYSEIKNFAGRGIPGDDRVEIRCEDLIKDSAKIKEIIDRKLITDFMKKSDVKAELLKKSLGVEKIDKRSERFLRLLSRL